MRLLVGISIFIAANVLIGLCFYLRKSLRSASLRKFADQNRLEFSKDCPGEIFSRYRFLNELQTPRRTTYLTYFNLIQGSYKGREIVFFDFYFRTVSKLRQSDGSFRANKTSVLILELDQSYPEIVIGRRGLVSSIISQLTEALNFNDVKIETSGFSKSFSVQSTDESFAKKFCNEEMIKFLFSNQDLKLEVDQNCLAFYFEPFMKPKMLEENLERLLEIQNRIKG